MCNFVRNGGVGNFRTFNIHHISIIVKIRVCKDAHVLVIFAIRFFFCFFFNHYFFQHFALHKSISKVLEEIFFYFYKRVDGEEARERIFTGTTYFI